MIFQGFYFLSCLMVENSSIVVHSSVHLYAYQNLTFSFLCWSSLGPNPHSYFFFKIISIIVSYFSFVCILFFMDMSITWAQNVIAFRSSDITVSVNIKLLNCRIFEEDTFLVLIIFLYILNLVTKFRVFFHCFSFL